MDIIMEARRLGESLQKTEEYIAYANAEQEMENDSELNGMIEQFNQKKIELSEQFQSANRDQEAINTLNDAIKELYNGIMNNDNMRNYNAAKEELSARVRFINTIISAAANGEDPQTVEESGGGCCGSGGCGSCSGCH